MDVDKLEAGPELDALIAEKVMGCSVTSIEFEGRVWFRCSCAGAPHGQVDSDGEKTVALQAYSTDIAAAWSVLEKFPWFRIDNRGDYEGNEAFMVELTDDVKNLAGKMWGPTAPLAICRAALKAVGA